MDGCQRVRRSDQGFHAGPGRIRGLGEELVVFSCCSLFVVCMRVSMLTGV